MKIPASPLALLSVLLATATPMVAQATSREEMIRRMHGTPPPAKPSDKAAEVSFADGVEHNKPISTFLTTLADALKTREPKAAQALLAEKFTIDGLPSDSPQSAAEVFGSAITQVKSPNAMVVTSLKQEQATLTVKVDFKFANRVAPKIFVFDAKGRLLQSDFFKINAGPMPAGGAEKPAGSPHG